MLGNRNCVSIAIFGSLVVLCSSNSVHRQTNAPEYATHFPEDHEEFDKTTEKPADLTTKEFRLPLCALPKKGPLLCYAICVFLLNDKGTCNPHNICSCTVTQTYSPGMLFGLFGK